MPPRHRLTFGSDVGNIFCLYSSKCCVLPWWQYANKINENICIILMYLIRSSGENSDTNVLQLTRGCWGILYLQPLSGIRIFFSVVSWNHIYIFSFIENLIISYTIYKRTKSVVLATFALVYEWIVWKYISFVSKAAPKLSIWLRNIIDRLEWIFKINAIEEIKISLIFIAQY